MYNLVKNTASKISNGRTPETVLNVIVQEVGELATEIAAKYDFTSYKRTNSEISVIEEAIDAIVSLYDLIYLDSPDITEEEINYIASLKLDKWAEKVRNMRRI